MKSTILLLVAFIALASSHRVERALDDFACSAGTSKITTPFYFRNNSFNWCSVAIRELATDYNNLAYRQECQRWLGTPSLPDAVAQIQLVYCSEFSNGTVQYQMGICCDGYPNGLRCFTGNAFLTWEPEFYNGHFSYKFDYENNLVTCAENQVCQQKLTYYGSSGNLYNISVEKGCGESASCAADSIYGTGQCQSCVASILTPICTRCCDTSFCNYDYFYQYMRPGACPESPQYQYPCNSYPCLNGGSCLDEGFNSSLGYTTYRCQCPPFWGGQRCEAERQLCTTNFCLNGGTCYNYSDIGVDLYRCNCTQPFVGDRCELRSNLTCNSADSNSFIPPHIWEFDSNIGMYVQYYPEFLNYWDYIEKSDNICTNLAWELKDKPERLYYNKNYVIPKDKVICGDLTGKASAYLVQMELVSCAAGTRNNYVWGLFRGCCHDVSICSTGLSPCLNGGTCYDYSTITPGDDYRCECPEGFVGDNCELRSNLTCNSSDPASIIKPYNAAYTFENINCTAAADYYRGNPSFVQYNYGDIIYECTYISSLTSLAGHPFRQGVDGHIGSDMFQFELSHCSRNDHTTILQFRGCCPGCLSSPCLNGGFCLQLDATEYICNCAIGFNGRHCENNSTVLENTTYPIITTVSISGPTVINRLWIAFNCHIFTSDINPSAQFVVQFLFSGSTRNVPAITTNLTALSVTLHERYLTGNIGTLLSCVVRSYYASTPAVRSQPIFSTNNYMLQLTPSISRMAVTETDPNPALVYIQSTLPVTCSDEISAAGNAPCSLAMTVQSADDIAVFQAGLSTAQACKYLLYEDDWDSVRSSTNNANRSLAVIAKSDPYVSGPRESAIVFEFPTLPKKTAGGFTYTPFWSQLGLTYPPLVYRSDSSSALKSCTATADVHWTTFDGLFFSSYGEGVFIYSRSIDGQPFEVQARQGSCSGPFIPNWITCVCGVAVREDNAILILDACQDGILRAIGYNHRNLPSTSGIFSDGSGNYFKIQTPSGNRVYVQYWNPILNIRIIVVGQPNIQGLCGSPDGDQSNDLIVQGTNRTLPAEAGGFAGPQAPLAVVDSWGLVKGRTLFEGYLASLSASTVITNSFQVPPTSTFPICSFTKSYYWLPGEPKYPVTVLTPKVPPITVVNNKRRRRSTSTDNNENIDDQYDPTQIKSANTSLVEVTWPTSNGITEQEAYDGCWQRIVSQKNLGDACLDVIANDSHDANDAVSKCVLDVQLTGNFSWANDKVAELQKSCYFRVITRNNSEVNDTNEAIAMAVSATLEVSAAVCTPFDCSGHGSCTDGACVCETGFIGADCAVSVTATPTALQLLTPTDCDVDNNACDVAKVYAQNAASVPSLTCRITVTMVNGSSYSYTTPGNINLPQTVTCPLPLDPLNYTAAVFPFAETFYQGYNFYCLPLGSPVLEYSIAISNDGIQFSNSLTMRVIDTECMNCTNNAGTTCSQLPNTCLINGYCFTGNDGNPYDPSLTCQPEHSRSLWSNQQGVPEPLNASCEPISCPTTNSVLHRAFDSTYSCVPRNASCLYGGLEIAVGSKRLGPKCTMVFCKPCSNCNQSVQTTITSICRANEVCVNGKCHAKRCSRQLKKSCKEVAKKRVSPGTMRFCQRKPWKCSNRIKKRIAQQMRCRSFNFCQIAKG